MMTRIRVLTWVEQDVKGKASTSTRCQFRANLLHYLGLGQEGTCISNLLARVKGRGRCNYYCPTLARSTVARYTLPSDVC